MAYSNRLRTMANYRSDEPNRLHLLILAIYAQHLLRACLRRQVSQTPSFGTIYNDCKAASLVFDRR
jgi:hypothetical protein